MREKRRYDDEGRKERERERLSSKTKFKHCTSFPKITLEHKKE